MAGVIHPSAMVSDALSTALLVPIRMLFEPVSNVVLATLVPRMVFDEPVVTISPA